MKFADRVKETTTSTSAAVITLGGTVATFRSFSSSLAVGDTGIPVSMDDGSGNWENGAYTLTNATTLTQTAIYASSNGGAPTVFPAGTKEVFCTLASEALNDLVDELRAEIGAGNSGVRDVPFAVIVPLSSAGQAFMPQTAVTGALTITPAAAAVRGALVYLRLVADGANLPNFAAFKEWGGSLGYDNRVGIVNEVQFFHDGVDSFVSFSQAIGAAPAPVEATAITMTGPTGGLVNATSTAFTVGTNGNRSAAVPVTPTPVTGVTFSPTSITLPTGTSTATFTFTPTTTGAKSIAVTNSAGLTNPAAITYTVTAAATAPDAPTIGTATAGDGYVDVAFTAPANNGGSAITVYTATLSTGETANGSSSPIRVTASNGAARTATARATNAIGTSSPSAASNSVTPSAPAAIANPRLTSTSQVVESGAGPYSYAGNGGVFSTPFGGITDGGLPTGGDGSLEVTLAGFGGTGNEVFFGLTTNTSPGAITTVAYALFASGQNGGTPKYVPYRSGTIISSGVTTVQPANGDKMRTRRTGTAVIVEVSKDSGSTWTTVYSWTGAVTTPFKFQVMPAGTAQANALLGVGLQ